MPILGADIDFDPRNHKSFLIPGYELESLGDIPLEKVGILNGLMCEAEELELEEQVVFCARWIALHGGVDAKRAKLAADVAKRDESLRLVESENRAAAHRAAEDDGVPV